MRFLNGLDMKRKLLLLLLFPLLGLLTFGASGVVRKYETWHAVGAMKEVVDLSRAIGAFVHESQRERGRTTIFLSGRGEDARTALVAQRKATDQRRSDLDRARHKLTSAGRGDGLELALEHAFDSLTMLERTRDEIDEGRLSVEVAFSYYNDLHANLLDVARQLVLVGPEVEIAAKLQAYDAVMRLKETAGIERALMGQTFELRTFRPGGFSEWMGLLARQAVFGDQFMVFAPTEEREAYRTHAQRPCVMQVETLRARVKSNPTAADFGVTPAQWFEQMTCKIDDLKTIEDRISHWLSQALAERQSNSFAAFCAFLAITLAVTSFSGWMAYSIVRHLASQTSYLVSTMRAFSEGDLDRHIEIASHDEIGLLSGAFNDMARRIKESTERERDLHLRKEQERARLRQRVALLRAFVESVATGDLTQTVEIPDDDDLTQLAQNMNRMTSSLGGMANQIRQASEAILTTLEEVQSAINVQSAGASEQAAAVSQTTTTLEQIKATSRQTMEKAQVLGRVAEHTRKESEQGLSAVEQAVGGIEAIRARVEVIAATIRALNERTQQIGEITGVVSSLAQQSKMLALNASIEAAKAGDAGRGFGVVADEVKELADQSHQATVQVQTILLDIRYAAERAVAVAEEGNREVSAGVTLVRRAGDSMGKLGEVIRETTIAGQQIVAAVRQEAAGIEQVNGAMREINRVTSQFVSSAQQTKVATADLLSVAERLRESVSVYKI